MARQDKKNTNLVENVKEINQWYYTYSFNKGDYNFSESFVHCLRALQQLRVRRLYSFSENFVHCLRALQQLRVRRLQLLWQFCPLFACVVVASSQETIASLEVLSTVCVRCSSSESGDYSFSGRFVHCLRALQQFRIRRLQLLWKFCPLFVGAVVAPSQETIASLEVLSTVCVRYSSSQSGLLMCQSRARYIHVDHCIRKLPKLVQYKASINILQQ